MASRDAKKLNCRSKMFGEADAHAVANYAFGRPARSSAGAASRARDGSGGDIAIEEAAPCRIAAETSA